MAGEHYGVGDHVAVLIYFIPPSPRNSLNRASFRKTDL